MLKRILIIMLLSLPLAVWAFFKPVRILAPELAGVTCVNERVCIDDSSRLAEASDLYQGTLQFVASSIGEIERPPRVVFCTTEICNESFGFKAAANTIGTFGIVISPRAWKLYYLRHEMIHHLQKERLGNFRGWLVTPTGSLKAWLTSSVKTLAQNCRSSCSNIVPSLLLGISR